MGEVLSTEDPAVGLHLVLLLIAVFSQLTLISVIGKAGRALNMAELLET